MTIKELRLLNESLTKCPQEPNNLLRCEIVAEIIKDDNCFKKIRKKDAFEIFKTLKISELEWENIYANLKRLPQNG